MNIIIFSFLALIFSYFPWLYNPFELSKQFVFAWIGLVFGVWLIMVPKYEIRVSKSMICLSLAYVGFNLLSSLISFNSLLSFGGSYERQFGALTQVWIFVFLFLTVLHLTKDEITKLIKVIAWLLLALSAYTVFEYYFPSSMIVSQFWWRPIWFIGQPNNLALILILPILYFIKQQGLNKLLALIPALALVLTWSRSGIVALLFWLLLLINNRILKVLSIVVIILVVVFVSWSARNNSIVARLVLWEDSFNMVWQDFWFWSGNETFQSRYLPLKSDIINLYENSSMLPDRAHNHLLDKYIEWWFFWLLVFYLLCIGVILRSKWGLILKAYLLSSLVFVQFNFFVSSTYFMFLLCLFMLYGLSEKAEFEVTQLTKVLYLALFIIYAYTMTMRVIWDYNFYRGNVATAISYYDNMTYLNYLWELMNQRKHPDKLLWISNYMINLNDRDYRGYYIKWLYYLHINQQQALKYFNYAQVLSKHDYLLCSNIMNNMPSYQCQN